MIAIHVYAAYCIIIHIQLVIDEIIGDSRYQGSFICPSCSALCYVS